MLSTDWLEDTRKQGDTDFFGWIFTHLFNIFEQFLHAQYRVRLLGCGVNEVQPLSLGNLQSNVKVQDMIKGQADWNEGNVGGSAGAEPSQPGQ